MALLVCGEDHPEVALLDVSINAAFMDVVFEKIGHIVIIYSE